MRVLQEYQACSGQLINNSKSCFLTSNKSPAPRRALIARETGYSFKAFPIRYLGCPLFTGRKSSFLFSELEDNIARRIRAWTSKWLSFGGRLVLIKFVLLSMPVYLLSVLAPPKGVIDRLPQLLGNFLWEAVDGKKRRHWMSWSPVC